MRSTEDWSRAGGVIIALLAAGVSALVLMPRMLGLATGPEVEVITWLKRTESDGLTLRVPGVAEPLHSQVHHFARITVDVAPGGERAVAWATLDFKGRLGRTEVSSLGVERVPFVRRSREWVPENLAAPRLAAVVGVLEARRRALEAGEPEALRSLLVPGAPVDVGGGEELERVLSLSKRRYRVEAWYVRLERDDALASELWRLEGDLPSQPVDDKGQRQLSLIRREEEFFFSPGLM
ncbi:hypothetical protein D187_003400 [Cystobacter fuscus DSM 2262]|uniref:Uncharacterized protein n=1 Tax=Cystobacter fuscus (strain ATCC 25194 / DSM 2262 / NBRC 100088 / M29) TaxID=1242864 RepID=S9QQY7_CYSF2|nr:hypothetical protein [Cystobacter fuscus]EPX59023.1 hypothetical protein D187_003400 [Cystobacter fuscus DSM 2262]